MLLSEQWLREWTNPAGDARELAERFTAGGLEIGHIAQLAESIEAIRVAEVLTVAPHPDADRLRLVEVNTGESAALRIVCGAPNVTAGMKTALAPVGARLPGGVRIKKSKIRGQPSEGMLCSAAELGLSDETSGILELPSACVPGTPLSQALHLDDAVLDLELTPNRGDCLSMRGASRELAALTGAAWHPPEIPRITPEIQTCWPVVLTESAGCPRYVSRVIEAIDNTRASPTWLTERLRRCGVRALSPAVDVTNYVLLELGQPMHAFDLDKLEGDIQVRRARPGETLELINDQLVTLDEDVLVIADDKGPVALAGVMGGVRTEVDAATTRVLLESAFFAPEMIAGRARRFKLHTEASHRFERGVDPGIQALAVERATALLVEIAGGQAGPVGDLAAEGNWQHRPPIELRRARINRVLGIEIPDQEVERILAALGFECRAAETGWMVTPAAHRFDVRIEEDLIEEIARLYGYDRIEPQLPRPAIAATIPADRPLAIAAATELLRSRGFHEVITYSFVRPDLSSMLTPQANLLAIVNPLSEDQSVMRASLWPGLVAATQYNRNRQQQGVRLFEIGSRFRNHDQNLMQDTVISGILAEEIHCPHWSTTPRRADFFDLKGIVEALLERFACRAQYRFERCAQPPLDPGQAAELMLDGERIGICGRLHPALNKPVGIEGDVFLFEIALDPLLEAVRPAYRRISAYPSVRRDLSIELPRTVTAGTLLDCVRGIGVETLMDAELFDVYDGPGVSEGYRSMSIHLTLGSDNETLDEPAVEQVIGQILTQVEGTLGGRLRSQQG
ncbi:MAG: phenylalanine--tRNA ligase subunit beta [Pseudomonadota bacterium]|nr:phenylalanine--tRNA ligase subunit beta [Pseudomonadota bacterium]